MIGLLTTILFNLLGNALSPSTTNTGFELVPETKRRSVMAATLAFLFSNSWTQGRKAGERSVRREVRQSSYGSWKLIVLHRLLLSAVTQQELTLSFVPLFIVHLFFFTYAGIYWLFIVFSPWFYYFFQKTTQNKRLQKLIILSPPSLSLPFIFLRMLV